MNDIIVSTMTAIASIGLPIDISKLQNYIDENNLSVIQNNENNSSNLGMIRYPLSKDNKIKSFKNQIQLHIPLEGNSNKIRQIKVKVFNNGRLHITGCQSIQMISKVINKMNMFLFKACVIKELFNEKITNENIDIVMVNMTIDANYHINQKIFRDLLINKYNIYAEFSPKTYAGINAHYKVDGIKQASFLIFQSGKINIAGAKGMFHLLSAKLFIENILQIEKNQIQLNV